MRRTHRVNIVLSDLEAHEFHEVARAAGRTLSSMLRAAVRMYGDRLGFNFGPNPADPTACPECGVAEGCDHVPGCPLGVDTG